MAKLNFNTQTSSKRALRQLKDVSLNRTIGEIEVSEGVDPALPLYPYKYLPVMVIDVASDEGIVLVKGTIVSLITARTDVGATPASGIVDPMSSGNIPVADDATTTAFDWIVANIDDDYWGYEQSTIGLLVPCNGGNASVIPYSALDTTIGTFADAGSTDLTIGANMPVGIVYSDVYQDIRGFNLNYQYHSDVYGIACKGFISVPYVDTNAVTVFGDDTDVAVAASRDTTVIYSQIWKKYAFFYFDGSGAGAAAGQILKSDRLGKFIPQATNAAGARTSQTVGKLIACDSRFPKDMVGAVQTYPGSQVTGTDTAGVPAMLYHFAKDCEVARLGTSVTAAHVLEQVQNGNFGLARIALDLA